MKSYQVVGSNQLLCMVTQTQKESQVTRKGLQLDILDTWVLGFLATEIVKGPKQ